MRISIWSLDIHLTIEGVWNFWGVKNFSFFDKFDFQILLEEKIKRIVWKLIILCAKKLDSGFHFFESKWMLSFKIVFIPLYLPLAGLTFYSLLTRMSYMVIYGTRTEFHLTKRVFALEISFTVQNASKFPGAHNGVESLGARALPRALRARIFYRFDQKKH